VNTVVASVDSQPSDTVGDDSATINGAAPLNDAADGDSGPADAAPESPTADLPSAPAGDPAGDAVPGDSAASTDTTVRDPSITDDVSGTPDDNDADNESRNIGVGGEPRDMAARPTDVTETLEANALLPAAAFAAEAFTAEARRTPAIWDAADAVTEIYHVHYNQFVRLAVLLLHDVQTAEEVVQDAFEAMHVAWRRLNDKDKALQYLRQTVVNKSRSVLRHRKVVDMHAPKPAPDEPSAEHAALVLLERSAVAAALRSLPERQREAIALRYYADFSEADIAKAMGISKGAVKSHTARAMATLKTVLTQETS
jgi:RNA polymerase sigma-70 factor (sigma-E family)